MLRSSLMLALAGTVVLAQPKDTSFTIWSAWQDIRDGYPFASPAPDSASARVIERRNIIYAAPDGRALHLDLFLPLPSEGVRPCVMLIHGGGWRSGSKEQEIPFAQRLAARGYAAATVEYRLSGEAKFPAAIHDLKGAVRWIRANTRAYGIDERSIAAVGGSAGGTLASFLGVTGDDAEWEGTVGPTGYSSALQAVVNIDGIVDFTHPAESGKDLDPAKPSAGARWFGATFAVAPDTWRRASPIAYAGRRQSAPVLFLNSGQERFRAGRDSMMVAMAAPGVHAEAQVFDGAPHTFWLFRPWFDDIVDRTDRFLQKTLGKRGVPE